jgi:predicted acyltransferase
MLLGLMAGVLLKSDKTENQKVINLILGGLVCMAVAVALSYTLCPVVKKIWTPAWTLFSGAWVLWILAALYWVIDVRGWKFWTFPLVVVGMNSLAMYLMGSLLKRWVSERFETYLGDEWVRTTAMQNFQFEIPKSVFGGPYGASIEAAIVFTIFWLICLYLYRNKLFLRI